MRLAADTSYGLTDTLAWPVDETVPIPSASVLVTQLRPFNSVCGIVAASAHLCDEIGVIDALQKIFLTHRLEETAHDCQTIGFGKLNSGSHDLVGSHRHRVVPSILYGTENCQVSTHSTAVSEFDECNLFQRSARCNGNSGKSTGGVLAVRVECMVRRFYSIQLHSRNQSAYLNGPNEFQYYHQSVSSSASVRMIAPSLRAIAAILHRMGSLGSSNLSWYSIVSVPCCNLRNGSH